jgi:predicted nucleic-acid-binding Zn-ribbon protein
VKSSHSCPKCGSRAVATLPDKPRRNAASKKTLQCPRCRVIHPSSAVTCDCGHRLPLPAAEDHLKAIRYLCARCGYTEHYVADAESVPWDRLEGLVWLNPGETDQGPYR